MIRWAPGGADPSAPRHQVVTLFGEASVRHLAWAVAAATRGAIDERLWRVRGDGSAAADGARLAPDQVASDAALLLASHERPLRRLVAELGRHGTSPESMLARGIRLPLDFSLDDAPDDDGVLAGLREAYGADVTEEPQEDELAA
ncbi:MAG: hypothetical protein MUF21_03690 [Gemmatimonadaceae bacterium]|nr:hypothetical protein [Gemmatimonadaceae bacterium]